MTYTITHGRIAAVQYVTDGLLAYTVIYMGDGKQPEWSRTDYAEMDAIPESVRAAVNRQFGIVFSLPVSERQACIDSFDPFTIEA